MAKMTKGIATPMKEDPNSGRVSIMPIKPGGVYPEKSLGGNQPVYGRPAVTPVGPTPKSRMEEEARKKQALALALAQKKSSMKKGAVNTLPSAITGMVRR